MIAVFDPVRFKTRYPEFASVSVDLLADAFQDAGLYLSNTDCSPVQNIDRRTRLLNMLTAHLAFLGGALSNGSGPGPVGRVASATEGTVSVSFAGLSPGSGDWFNQTGYGAAFWQATVSLRSFKYAARPADAYGQQRGPGWPNGFLSGRGPVY